MSYWASTCGGDLDTDDDDAYERLAETKRVCPANIDNSSSGSSSCFIFQRSPPALSVNEDAGSFWMEASAHRAFSLNFVRIG